jgi:hypothetical protein
MDDSALVVVHTFGTPQEANLAKSALDAAGIDSMVQGDSGGGQRMALAWAGSGYQVIVREEDLKAATEILDIPAKPE